MNTLASNGPRGDPVDDLLGVATKDRLFQSTSKSMEWLWSPPSGRC